MHKQVVLFIVLLFFSVNLVAAQPTPTAPYPVWQGQFQVRPDLPFAWVRHEPASNAAIWETVPPGARMLAFTPTDGRAGMLYDGVQWWGYVRGPNSVGWLELTALILTDPLPIDPFRPTATPMPADSVQQRWAAGNVVRVRASVPFVYVRVNPDSGQVAGTLMPGARMLILGNPQRGPAQPNTVWWQVREAANNGYTVGWVEQQSLEFVRSRANFRLPPLPRDFWRSGFVMRVKATLPFAWIRAAAASDAGIVHTLRPGDEVMLGGDIGWDGVQNWRAVGVRGTPFQGYVEEQALEFVRLFTYP